MYVNRGLCQFPTDTYIQEDINSGERCMAIWLVCYYIRRIHHSIDVDCSIVRSNNYIVKRIIISCIRFIIWSAWILISFARIIKLSAQFIILCERNIISCKRIIISCKRIIISCARIIISCERTNKSFSWIVISCIRTGTMYIVHTDS